MSSRLWFAAWEEVHLEKSEKYIFETPVLPELNGILENLEGIKKEYSDVISSLEDGEGYKGYFQDELQFPGKSWSTLPILVFGLVPKQAKYFPALFSLLKSEPYIIGCFFSKTGAQSSIKSHSGISNCMYRCHLGINVPSSQFEKCGMRVGTDKSAWFEDRFVYFNDSNHHESWNNTDSERVIMIVDVLKEEFRPQWRFIQSRIIWSYVMLQVNEKLHSKNFRRFLCSQSHKPILNILAFWSIPFLRVLVKVKNWITKQRFLRS